MSDTPVFLRPINITASNNSWSIDASAKTIGLGTYGSIINVIHEFDDQCGANTNVYLNSSFKVVIAHNDSFTITWTDADLAALLGYSGFEVAAQVGGVGDYYLTATYTPSHMWLPTYPPYDRGRFSLKQRDIFSGCITQNGNIAGISTGPSLYYRDFSFAHEPALNVKIEAATSETYEARCFEYFASQCRTVQVSASTDVCAKGFYFFPDKDVAIGLSDDNPATKTSGNGGINFAISDKYAFCQLDPNGPEEPTVSLPVTRSYYNIGFTAHTADAPTWDY